MLLPNISFLNSSTRSKLVSLLLAGTANGAHLPCSSVQSPEHLFKSRSLDSSEGEDGLDTAMKAAIIIFSVGAGLSLIGFLTFVFRKDRSK